MEHDLKHFYASYHDAIFSKRYNSELPVRRQVHRDIYDSVLQYIEPGLTVLDAGGGEGVLASLMALKGAKVTSVDLSVPNCEASRKTADLLGAPQESLSFIVGDAEALPFADGSFDCVVSNHVLEHLPNFQKGLKEIYRVTRETAIVAVPTCLNPLSWSLLGGAPYYAIGKRSVFAMPKGILRVLYALVTRAEGVDEGYGGNKHATHVFRFPSRVKRMILRAGFKIIDQQAQSLRLPYFALPVDTRPLHRWLKSFGFGTVYLLKKR